MHLQLNFSVEDKSHLSNNINLQYDCVFVCGSGTELGNWNILDAIELKFNTQVNKWQADIDLKVNGKIEYKYFLAAKSTDSKKKVLFLKQLESVNRVLDVPNNIDSLSLDDRWRVIDNKLTEVFNGWLLNGQFELQFCIYNQPLSLFDDTKKDDHISLDIQPYRINDDSAKQHFQLINDYTLTCNVSD